MEITKLVVENCKTGERREYIPERLTRRKTFRKIQIEYSHGRLVMGAPKGQKVYDPATVAEIFDRMSKGETLRSICRDPGMPGDSTVRAWVLADSPAGIAAQYAQARDLGLDAMADQLLDIANTTEEGISVKTTPTGKEVTRADMLGHRRLKTDTLKWYLSKLAPKRYGDRLELDGKVGVDVGDAILAARKRAGGA